ncbi:hypothetical protein GUJ93_ZPchr0006g43426 [Zizania palustris]|uniref:Uncharacterized protein n=1 Tax=Zizania palustris TaxID=103762 RepID=A0A8J5T4T2_ZIZPA|nr:hypothetical protein GUJ93_ZPchr0006g43426 [Zizania palustris]
MPRWGLGRGVGRSAGSADVERVRDSEREELGGRRAGGNAGFSASASYSPRLLLVFLGSVHQAASARPQRSGGGAARRRQGGEGWGTRASAIYFCSSDASLFPSDPSVRSTNFNWLRIEVPRRPLDLTHGQLRQLLVGWQRVEPRSKWFCRGDVSSFRSSNIRSWK